MSTPARDVRRAARAGVQTGMTIALAPGFVQANLVILPRAHDADFQRFCARNPRACPLLASSAPGDPSLPTLGDDIDLRTDLPRYRVWQDGALVAEVPDIARWWRDDLVAYALGCSFSFEEALLAAGLPLRHRALGCAVPVYRSALATVPAGVFHGPLAVSMRPFRAADAIRAIQITSRFPAVHGAPVHIGDPSLIGIDDLDDVYEGDAVEVAADELPVFWACGVTPQAVVLAAKPRFCITHAPGHMLVTDRRNAELAVL